jgi:glycosyltransferase involved in cell wall biosynthesis
MDKRKTILILLWKDLLHPYAGGGVFYAFRIAKEWIKQGHKVIFLCPKFKGSKNFEVIEGCEVHRVGNKYTSYLFFPWYYLTRLNKRVTHIVDIENGIPYFSPLFSKKPKVMLTYHLQKEVFFQELPWLIAWFPYFLELKVMPFVYYNTPIITICKESKKELIRIGFSKNNISIGYCGLDFPQFKKKNKTLFPSVLYLGRIEQYKRVDLLINLFEKANVKGSKLIIAGSGRQLEKIKLLAKNSKSNVEVLGRVTEKQKFELFSQCWVNATASEKEGWGMTVIEGNSMNTPAIGFNIPGLSESIEHNINGWLAEDESDFVIKLTSMLTNKTNFPNLIGHSKKFNWETTSNLILQKFKLRN